MHSTVHTVLCMEPTLYDLALTAACTTRRPLNPAAAMHFSMHAKETTSMNQSLLPLAVNDQVTLVEVKYHTSGNAGTPRHTTAILKTIDTLEKGDQVVIEADGACSVARVTKVDVLPQFNSNTQYRWVIQKVDFTAHESCLEQEEQLIKATHTQRKAAVRAQLAEIMKDQMGVDTAGLTFAPVTSAPTTPGE